MIGRLYLLTCFMTLGASPGLRAADPVDFQRDVLPIVSEHCTLCHLKLTFRFQGRDYRLTDVHGRIVHELIA